MSPDVKALCDRAVAAHQAGRPAEAEQLYLKARALDPGNFTANYLLGVIQHGRGESGAALASVETALKSNPASPAPFLLHGMLLEAQGRDRDALASYGRALSLHPSMVEALIHRGSLQGRLGRFEAALADFDHALRARPDFPIALFNRGTALLALQRPAEALAAFDRMLAREPANPAAQFHRGSALSALGRPEEALAAFGRAPRDFNTLAQTGMLLQGLQRFDEAVAAYDAALVLEPHAVVMTHRGGALQALRRTDEARAAYDAALRLDPDQAGTLDARAQLNWQQKNFAAAAADLEALLKLDPGYDYASGLLLHLNMQAGDWRGHDGLLSQIEEGLRAGRRVASPFVLQALSTSPAALQSCARLYNERRYPASPPLWRPRPRNARIRIGYLCGEFRDQATSVLAAGLFERHDKSRFELFAFDNGWNDDSPLRARLEKAFEHFIPIAHLNDDAAARAVADAGIDILVCLNGYFGLARMGVFARKPAPLQVNYLGFPGTLGAPYMDYIVADRIVIPEDDKAFFDEKVAWLPHSYQPNDDKRPVAAAASRAAHGLPDDAFVFCNFNQAYKLTPATFDSWMRIVAAVPHSLLWLWGETPNLAENLRREAERRGVAGSRLVFAPSAAHGDHLARLALADLALDSLPYNAHTTGSDALWAGLPLLTCRGNAFAGRVAASLLTAVGLPELITENPADFEARAIALAQDRAALASLRARLRENRRTMPLFDTGLYTRHIEAAYRTMWDRFARGEAPAAFAVEA